MMNLSLASTDRTAHRILTTIYINDLTINIYIFTFSTLFMIIQYKNK